MRLFPVILNTIVRSSVRSALLGILLRIVLIVSATSWTGHSTFAAPPSGAKLTALMPEKTVAVAVVRIPDDKRRELQYFDESEVLSRVVDGWLITRRFFRG